MQNNNELRVWQKSHSLTLKVYEVTKLFPKDELYSLTNQLRRATSSIPANIAEGGGKNSNNELAHFLNITLGSANGNGVFLVVIKGFEVIFAELEDNINEIKRC